MSGDDWEEQERRRADFRIPDAPTWPDVLEHAPDCPRPGPVAEHAGAKADGAAIYRLECPYCHAGAFVDGPLSPPMATGVPESEEPARRRGRPKGSGRIPERRIVATFRELEAKHHRNPTQLELAKALDDIGVRTLQDALQYYELPWPIE